MSRMFGPGPAKKMNLSQIYVVLWRTNNSKDKYNDKADAAN